MPHVLLLGDSVLDNSAYTAGGPAVADHLRRLLHDEWIVDLLAVDGSTTEDISEQLQSRPTTATHLVLSVGGNNALLRADILETAVASSGQAFGLLASAVAQFRAQYRQMLIHCLAARLPLVVCTIYNGNFPQPEYQAAVRVALSAFNDVIVEAAMDNDLRVLELRRVCNTPADFANPLEPSVSGGAKVAEAIRRALVGGRFSGPGAHIAV
jgi:GDSL-like Lipase/Acylhydrolase family